MLEHDKSWQDIRTYTLPLKLSDKSKDSGLAPITKTNTSLSTQVLKSGTYLEKTAFVDPIHANFDEVDIE